MKNLVRQKQQHSHREGQIGREILFSWDPSLIKNGEKWHHLAMAGGRLVTPKDVRKGVIKEINVPMRSFVANYYKLLGALWNNGTVVSITDTSGNANNLPGTSTDTNVMDMLAAANVSTYGLVVGSGNTAVARTDTKLVTQIAHGTSDSTLQHGAMTVGVVTNPSGSISRVAVSRTFTGNTGSTVSIAESGIYHRTNTASSIKLCMERNLTAFGAVAASQVVTGIKNLEITT